uniref:Uncharacterized protein n=1 Tax=Anguilla anguilla TaxID=7936 RepID=A0A0E9QDU9_ANGAN
MNCVTFDQRNVLFLYPNFVPRAEKRSP